MAARPPKFDRKRLKFLKKLPAAWSKLWKNLFKMLKVSRPPTLPEEPGFAIDPFAERDYAIRAVPAGIAASDAAAAVEEICEKLHGGKAPDPDSARDEILHTVACKAAIKAGWDTDVKELETLVDAVLSGQIKYCPHGRPISVTVTRRDLDKLFKRIV